MVTKLLVVCSRYLICSNSVDRICNAPNPIDKFICTLAGAKVESYQLVTLLCACRQGIVTDEMIAAPDKRLFALNGLLEAMSQLLGLVGASKLPGGPPVPLNQPLSCPCFFPTSVLQSGRVKCAGCLCNCRSLMHLVPQVVCF